MGYTLDQLEAMGAKPVTPQATATPQASTATPKKKYSLQELQSMGATPVSAPTPTMTPEGDGFLKTLAKDAFKTLVTKPIARATELVGRTGILGDKIKTGYEEMSKDGDSQRILGTDVEAQKAFGDGGGKQIAGDALKTASYLFPYGTAAKAATIPLSKVATPALAKLGGYVASGATGGYLADVGYDLEEGKSVGEALKPGMGTAIGAAIPLAGPAVRGVGRIAGEALGVSTGAGYGAIKEGLKATTRGGEAADAFKGALKGDISPEQIVDESRNALGTIIKNRTQAYRSQLEKLKTNTKEFDTKTIVEKFNKQLEDFGVTFDEKGLPDFSRSPGLQRYQKDLTNMSQVLANWGTRTGDNTVVGIDKLKQVLDDFRIGSRDSAKFDSFVTALRNQAKTIIKNEPGYDKLVKDYETSTGLIKEIQRGLSLGDRAQTDTAFRKLTGALRTNNEFRKQLIDELGEITGGTLTPKIAGQQLSEIVPRGLSRIVTPALGVGGAFGGVGIIPILQALMFTSPRLIGNLLRVLGFSANKIKKVINAITPKGLQFPGDMLYDEIMGNKLPKKPQNLAQALSENASTISETAPITASTEKMSPSLDTSIDTIPDTLPQAETPSSIPTGPRVPAKTLVRSRMAKMRNGLPKPEITKKKINSFEKAPNLSLSDRRIENKAFQKVIDSEEEILNAYKEKRGKVINTDEFRPFFSDVGYKGTNSMAVQEPSSYLAKRAFTEALKNPGEFAVFQAGGSGVGKTKAVKRLRTVSREMRDAAVILDSNFSSYSSAIKKLKETRNAGKKEVINFVYRDPVDSLVNGVVKRMLHNKEEMGRLVPAKVIAENHVDSFNVAKRLQDEGYMVRYIDNSLGYNKSRITKRSRLEEKIGNMSKAVLLRKFTQKIKELYKHGIITKEQLNGYLPGGA